MRWIVLTVILLAITPVAFSQQTATIKLYFNNTNDDPTFEYCGKVFPVSRSIPKTKAVADAVLKEFFKGPTKEEEGKKYSGYGPPETDGIYKSINVKNGAAYVNFTKRFLDQMGTATTSCGSESFYSTIETTLKQFPTIKKIYYAIEGDTNIFYDRMQVGDCPYGKHCAKSNFK